jgi:hypothetical protein
MYASSAMTHPKAYAYDRLDDSSKLLLLVLNDNSMERHLPYIDFAVGIPRSDAS